MRAVGCHAAFHQVFDTKIIPAGGAGACMQVDVDAAEVHRSGGCLAC